MKSHDYADKEQEGKPQCVMIPEVFYPAGEVDKLLELIRPVLGETRRLVAENPGEYPIFEWFMRSFQLCYEDADSLRT